MGASCWQREESRRWDYEPRWMGRNFALRRRVLSELFPEGPASTPDSLFGQPPRKRWKQPAPLEFEGEFMVGGAALTAYVRLLTGKPKLSCDTVWRWVRQGIIPAKRQGKIIITSKTEVRRALATTGVVGAAAAPAK
jgi:hypothetical protein